MRLICVLALSLTAVLPGFCQSAANAGPGLPKEPRAVFAAAAPFYDFSDPTLKPWHLKASYQLYDEKGKPSEQGTFEYWWAAPTVYRISWTRPSATRTVWYTADGNYAQKESGERLSIYEARLSADYLWPLPRATDLDPAKVGLEHKTVSMGKVKVSCIILISLTPQHELIQGVPLGSYCFDPQFPVLRRSYSLVTVTTDFNKIVKMQNRYLASEILVFDGERELLSAQMDPVTAITPSDPAFTPSPDAAVVVKLDNKLQIRATVMAGKLIKKTQPIYPRYARDEHITGTVVLKATIGKDGKVRDLHVIASPSPVLSGSAKEAVSHWVYEPYLFDGKPVEVETLVYVVYQ